MYSLLEVQPFFVRQGALLSGYRCLFIAHKPNSITLFMHSAPMLSGGLMPDGRPTRLRVLRVSHIDRNRQGYATLLGAQAHRDPAMDLDSVRSFALRCQSLILQEGSGKM